MSEPLRRTVELIIREFQAYRVKRQEPAAAERIDASVAAAKAGEAAENWPIGKGSAGRA
jgi:hypothetical protein